MSKTKVMVVDDDPMMIDLARYQLQSRGYEVLTAETGQEALKLNADQHSEVVLTDLQLPDIDGIELVRQLKENAPGTEIIMVTGYGSVNGAIEATKAGAFYFIEKPVEFEELFVLIEKAIERSRQAEEIRLLRDRLTNKLSYYNIIGSSKDAEHLRDH